MSVPGTALDRSAAALDRARVETPPDRLLIVSNRLPLTLKKGVSGWRSEPSAGGLATALSPLMARTRGLSIGWPGELPAGRLAHDRDRAPTPAVAQPRSVP